jgi:DNA-binding transcriptional ArsR family regulator
MPTDVLYLDSAEQASEMLKPMRLDILRLSDQPRTCSELGDILGHTPQNIYYHVKRLEGAGLMDRVGERKVRGILEGIYQARARSYWLAPTLVNRLGGLGAARDQASLRVLCSHAERMLEDVGHLANHADHGAQVPSLSLSADVELSSPQGRAEFLREVQEAFVAIAERYGAREPSSARGTFHLTLVCYPDPSTVESS